MNKMLKPTIISISMATVMAGAAISPALGLIAQAFPHADPLIIKLILTAPSLMIIPFSFISSFLTKKISKRSVLLMGLVVYLLAGVGAQFSNSVELLLALRLVLGAGVGLVMPLSMSLIGDYFTGKERTKMMGYNSAFSNFGGIITMTLAGFLAGYGWRMPFNVYFIGFFIMIMVFFFLPKDSVQDSVTTESKQRMPLAVYGAALAMGAVMVIYYSIATNMALYLEQNQLGGAGIAGTVISFTTVGGMTTSVILVRLQDWFKKYIVPVTLLVMGIAFAILSLTQWIAPVYLAVCFVGFGQGILFPIFALKALNAAAPHQSDQAIAITSSFTFLGQFISPVILDGIGRMVNNPTIRFQYGVIAICVILVTVVCFVQAGRSRDDVSESSSGKVSVN